MPGQVGDLLKQVGVQGVDGALQLVHRGHQGADDGPFGVKLRIVAVEVVLDQLAEIAVIVLIGELLPWREVEPRLIEATAQPLAVLHDEARHETAGHHGACQQQSIEQTTQQQHRSAT